MSTKHDKLKKFREYLETLDFDLEDDTPHKGRPLDDLEPPDEFDPPHPPDEASPTARQIADCLFDQSALKDVLEADEWLMIEAVRDTVLEQMNRRGMIQDPFHRMNIAIALREAAILMMDMLIYTGWSIDTDDDGGIEGVPFD